MLAIMGSVSTLGTLRSNVSSHFNLNKHGRKNRAGNTEQSSTSIGKVKSKTVIFLFVFYYNLQLINPPVDIIITINEVFHLIIGIRSRACDK